MRAMPAIRTIAVPPSSQALKHFFREPRTLSVGDAASLIGWTKTQLKRRAMEEEALLRGNLIRWRDAAAWLLESWPRQWVMDALGGDADILPVGLHPTRVTWSVPFYLVHAMNVQWRLEALPHRTVRPATMDDYMSDVLHRAVDADTLAILRRDPDFADAFEFPRGDEE